ncbi:MAG: EAL domain-containing protein [Thermoleophilia bacterium]
MRDRFPRGWAIVVMVAMALAVAYGVLPFHIVGRVLLFNLPVGVAAAAAIMGAVRMWRVRRGPWLALAIALAGFFVGETIWTTLDMLGLSPYPSVADVVFVSSYLPLGLTSVLLARGGGEPDRSAWLDAGMVALIAGLGMWVTIVEPVTHASNESLAARLFTIAYPLMDLLVIVLVLRLVLHRGARTTASMLYTAGILFTLIADLSFSWLDLHSAYHDGSWVDTSWLFGYLLLGSAGLHPSAANPPQEYRENYGIERGRLTAVVGSVLLPLGVLVYQFRSLHILGFNTPTVSIAVSAGVMLLVAVRLYGLLGRTRRMEKSRGEERLSSLIHHSADSILLVDRRLQITFGSPAAQQLWDTELAGTAAVSHFHPEDREALTQKLTAALRASPDVPLPVECRTHDRALEGTLINLTENPAVDALVMTLRDVTVRRELEAQLERRAFHDDLTGLANRALFMDRVHHALARLRRHTEEHIAVVFIDLDDFKAVNDGMGHGAGDRLLMGVGERLRTCVRDSDTVARLGGDEFALLLENLHGPGDARGLALRALEMLHMPLRVLDKDLSVRASAGVAMAALDSTVETLLGDADIAMYSAKSAGKGQVAMFEDSLRDVAHKRLEIKVDLPEALRQRQFRLEYQPIHDLAQGGLRGFEALIRWDHPERGLVSPVEFIPGAEESGLIGELGRWVLHEACRQLGEWNRRWGSELTMNINVSGVQLRDPGLMDDVANALAANGIPPRLVTLEITESVMVEHASSTDMLDSLRSIGVGLAIDDFGTGYSSLAYLRHFPVTSVKIDRTFIQELSPTTDSPLVRSVVSLARSLQLTTVAEGVETQEQLEALDKLNCGLVQGFYLGRPQPPDEVETRLDGQFARLRAS